MIVQSEAAEALPAVCTRKAHVSPVSANINTIKARLFGSETAVEITNRAIQVMGGHGYSSECTVERLFRDARADASFQDLGMALPERCQGGVDSVRPHGPVRGQERPRRMNENTYFEMRPIAFVWRHCFARDYGLDNQWDLGSAVLTRAPQASSSPS